jgi:hypothetical protein
VLAGVAPVLHLSFIKKMNPRTRPRRSQTESHSSRTDRRCDGWFGIFGHRCEVAVAQSDNADMQSPR